MIVVDAQGGIVYANPMVEDAFGWTPDELRGSRIEQLVPERFAALHEAHRAAFARTPSARAMGSGLELSARRRDGTEFPAEIVLAPVSSRRGPLVITTIVDITERAETQSRLASAYEQLQLHAEEMEQRTDEFALFARLGELLESCQTLEEAYGVIGVIAEQAFPGDTGALYALDPSLADAEAVVTWGSAPPEMTAFSVTDCWALRRGRMHVVAGRTPELSCPHVDEAIATEFICEPLTAQTETLGLLHLRVHGQTSARARGALLADRVRLVQTLGARLALALANIRLRETLREQSSRDGLTGLLNRRSMEDALERELRRAEREDYAVSILMVDLDHFKDLNDSFGHAAGDAVLRGLGEYLAGAVRGGDVACRYGGEEFVMILPTASLADGARRAEVLREAVKSRQNENLPRAYPVTMSIGVAAYPGHGTTAQGLLLAADAAMYRAKELGRNRVVVAGVSEGRSIEVSTG